MLLFAFATGMIAIYAYVHFDTHGSHEAIEERTLQEQARQFTNEANSRYSGSTVSLSKDWQQAYENPDSGFYYSLFDPQGRLVANSPNLPDAELLPLFDTSLEHGEVGKVHFVGPQSIPALAARLPDGRLVVVARKPLDEEAFAESLIEERSEPVWVFFPFASLAFVIIVVVTRYTLRPLQNASAQAATIGPDSLDARIPIEKLPSELRPLVDAFNRALDRLTQAYTLEKRITVNAAHELRTPLSVLSLRLQRARMGTEVDWSLIENDLARVTRLVSQLLDLARKEASETIARTRTDLSRIVREAAADILPLAEDQDREIIVKAEEPVEILGNAPDLHDMVRNLIENALQHGRGAVVVGVEEISGRKDGLVVLTVRDEGRLLTAEDPNQLFERFRRGRTEASGSGLGLAIVKQVATSHGGNVQLSSEKETIFRVELPIQAGPLFRDPAQGA